ncbi:hypothetical protein FOB72_17955 (plasmid) [Cupriavidus pauculus]|uniref:Uncharacterized protein n=1 Tax=Cupriavidus pauculus TaxID=82633 RepID=A0A5P2H7T0_9BURK|nr:hypothetical protein [Cupriavidus pauculus]QET04036.1 hypothetical protein FOB72_17955 [Cupriavidus pauculus]
MQANYARQLPRHCAAAGIVVSDTQYTATMRFTRFRFERYAPIQRNARRESAFARKQTRERERYPLFTDHVAADQHSADDEFARRQRQSDRFEATQRAFHARVWRESRTRFFSLPEPVKQQIRDKWRLWTGPTTALYFSFMVDELSGDQARRVAEAAARQREYMARRYGDLGNQQPLELAR